MVAATITTPAEPLAELAAALDRVDGTAWNGLDDDQLLGSLHQLVTLRNRLDALAGEVAVAAHNGAVQRDGARTTAQWIGANTAGSPKQTRADVTAAKWLLDYATFRDAHAEGVLSRRHVDLLRAAENPITRASLLRDQHMLVDFATTLTLDRFSTALQYWVNAADPDGEIPDHQTMREHVRIRRTRDGSATVDASLDPLKGTAVHNAVETEIQRLRNTTDGANLTVAQLRVQAFVNLIARGAQRPDGTMTTPLINVVVGHTLLEELIAHTAGSDTTPVADADDPNRRCEFIDGTPLHPRFIQALLGVAEIRRIVLDAKSHPIDISYKTRAFPQWMRDAGLVATRGRCAQTGCDAPFHWLHADHIQPVAKGGQTRLNNEQPLCRPDNHAKTDTWHPPDKPAA